MNQPKFLLRLCNYIHTSHRHFCFVLIIKLPFIKKVDNALAMKSLSSSTETLPTVIEELKTFTLIYLHITSDESDLPFKQSDFYELTKAVIGIIAIFHLNILFQSPALTQLKLLNRKNIHFIPINNYKCIIDFHNLG